MKFSSFFVLLVLGVLWVPYALRGDLNVVLAAEDRPPIPPFKAWREVAPEKIKAFAGPQAERVALPNGMVMFLLEDHELPLIEGSLTLRVGQIHDPPEKAGLASLMAEVLRSGGSERVPGDELDTRLDDLAASISAGIGLESGSAGFSCLKEDFEKVFGLFEELLRRPAFPQDKLALALTQARTRIAKRNDNPSGIAHREFAKALYARKDNRVSPWARHPEYETLNAITRQDLVEFHRAHFQPNRFILSLVGDFSKAEMRMRLEKAFNAWPAAATPTPELPDPGMRKGARVLFVERPHLGQTTLLLGHPMDMRRDAPEYPAVILMNEVLSGGMSARLFNEVRTKKGLAYAVGGRASVYFNRPGYFYCSCLTRNEQALEALEALREEVVRLREHGVTAKELEEARESELNSFVFDYDTAEKVAGLLRTNEFHGYPLDFDRKLFELLKTISVEDVNRVAKKCLEPDKLLWLVVGNSGAFSRPLDTMGKVENIDVTIPAPRRAPLVIDPEKEARGRKLLEEALQAAGGVKPFQELQSVRADMVLNTGSLRLKAAMRAVLPGKVRVDVAGPFGPVTQIVSAQAAWQASGSWVKAIPPEEARKNLRALVQTDLGILSLLASGREGYNLQAVESVREGGRVLAGLVLESESLGRVTIYFDEKTKLMARVRYPLDGLKEAEKTFLDHASFGGLKLARRIEDTDPKARAKVIEMAALQLNPQLDDALFEKPAQATAPPEALKGE